MGLSHIGNKLVESGDKDKVPASIEEEDKEHEEEAYMSALANEEEMNEVI